MSPRDPSKRRCGECGDTTDDFDWCDVCNCYVCIGCNDNHDCDIFDTKDVDGDDVVEDDEPIHTVDCPGAPCQGECIDDEESEDD